MQPRYVLAALLALVASSVVGSLAAAAPLGTLVEFPANSGSAPFRIASGADGNLWFSDQGVGAKAIGRITPEGAITKFRTGLNAGTSPNGITPAADGYLWFTDQGTPKAIGRIKTSGTAAEIGTIQEFTAGLGGNANPAAITTAADGTLWFTDQSTVAASRAIGRVTPDGAITESSAGLLANGQPIEVTPGADGKLWFSQQASPAGALGQITMTGATWTITNYPLPTGAVPGGIRTGPDGNLWFLDNVVGAQKIAQFGVGAPAASTGIAISGGGDLGAAQTCRDTWSDWAGQQPSRTALGFDGYQWLLDGNAIAGQTAQSYMPTAGDVGHQLSCKVTVTYMLFPTTVSATSAAVLVKGPSEQVADLGDAVEGVGPGASLRAKMNAAAASLARNAPGDTCSILNAFMHEVNAQTGKKISPSTAATLVADATRIETLLGC